MSSPAAADPQLALLSDIFPSAHPDNLRLALRQHGGQVERAVDDLLEWSEEQLAAEPEADEEEEEAQKQREVHTIRISLQQCETKGNKGRRCCVRCQPMN